MPTTHTYAYSHTVYVRHLPTGYPPDAVCWLLPQVVTAALQLIGLIVGRVGWPVRTYLDSLMEQLISLLGDNKIIIRHSNIKLINKVMQTLTPGPVLEHLVSHLNHENWRVREEIVNIIILCVSSSPTPEKIDFELLVGSLLPRLADEKPRVK